ncbi:MAG: hypothetical protein KAR21_21050 [Spirochaetales bacterium]|nr:hypothetical protein [Spirochaetales bacterium]
MDIDQYQILLLIYNNIREKNMNISLTKELDSGKSINLDSYLIKTIKEIGR